jgi:methyltransferase OMS1
MLQALTQAAQLLKPGGQLLLLEHGRSHYGWLNTRLDSAAQKHFNKWGCWWNRDISDLVKQAGLKVESSWRWHFGTSFVIRAEVAAKQH